MIALVATNLRRRLGRTLLTATGIAVGVATIVALLSLTKGLQESAGEMVHLGRADLGLFQRDASDPTTSVLPLGLVQRVKALPEVRDATGIQLLIEAVPSHPEAVVFGADPRGFLVKRLVMTSGQPAGAGQVVIGDRLAESAHLKPGDRLRIKRRSYEIAGVYHSGILFEDGGAIAPLPLVQRLSGRTSTEVTTIAIEAEPRASAKQIARVVKRAFPGVLAIGTPEEAARAGANAVLIGKAALLIVVLALIVGGLGVANTMVMSVLERQRELALLATVGWSRSQLATIVMGEAIAVSLLGAALGLGLGVAAAEALAHALGLSDFVAPVFAPWGMGRGLLVGVLTGVIGGLYPAWRVTRLAPAPVLAGA